MVKVTVPSLTLPVAVLTVALRVTVWLAVEKVLLRPVLVTVVVVFCSTVRVWALAVSLLAVKSGLLAMGT